MNIIISTADTHNDHSIHGGEVRRRGHTSTLTCERHRTTSTVGLVAAYNSWHRSTTTAIRSTHLWHRSTTTAIRYEGGDRWVLSSFDSIFIPYHRFLIILIPSSLHTNYVRSSIRFVALFDDDGLQQLHNNYTKVSFRISSSRVGLRTPLLIQWYTDSSYPSIGTNNAVLLSFCCSFA